MIDIHSHILPGIDDGACDMDASMDLVRELFEQGVTDVIATPHYVDETFYTSSRKDNLELLKDIKARVKETGMDINIYLGNEIYISDKIDKLLENGEISALNNGKYLLVELPMSGEFPGYEDILDDLMRRGYKVILAHPERYTSFQKDFGLAEQMYKMGVLLQCNIGSINGQYGKKAKKTIKQLAKRKMIFVFGTDIHHTRGIDVIPMAKKKLLKYYNEAELEGLLSKNARQIIG